MINEFKPNFLHRDIDTNHRLTLNRISEIPYLRDGRGQPLLTLTNSETEHLLGDRLQAIMEPNEIQHTIEHEIRIGNRTSIRKKEREQNIIEKQDAIEEASNTLKLAHMILGEFLSPHISLTIEEQEEYGALYIETIEDDQINPNVLLILENRLKQKSSNKLLIPILKDVIQRYLEEMAKDKLVRQEVQRLAVSSSVKNNTASYQDSQYSPPYYSLFPRFRAMLDKGASKRSIRTLCNLLDVSFHELDHYHYQQQFLNWTTV